MKNNKIAESIQKIMPDEAVKDYLLKNALDRAKSGTHETGKELHIMTNNKSHYAKRLKPALIAAVIALALFTTVSFAYGGQIIQLLGGGRIESGKTADGDDYISISSFESNPAEIRDGRVYFILDGSDTDITSHCTEATYYKYEQIADNGYRHVIIVGGTPDKLGWSEFIWDEKGDMVGSTARYYDINGEQPEWLRLAEEALRD
ncbi:MAG: hypothetical protein LBC82_05740 [Oscillospiraceae bacterium]|nr:hypothetical protein [Oscillospiraceae bacterium]